MAVQVTTTLAGQLEQDGIVLLPNLVTPDQLRGMQVAFRTVLHRIRWSDSDGYEKTERHRHLVQNVLTLDQGFVDVALHPLVKETLAEYVGPSFELVEAKGWLSLPTKKDFHGWHGDAWYDQSRVTYIPREVKLGLYLTDVRSGAFNYIKRTHGKQHPKTIPNRELANVPKTEIVEACGPAGYAFLFDTTGIHRQSVPILEPREAVFFNYHDPSLALQKEDIEYYRYHPLLLNAAFLGGLTEEDRRILGFGNKTNYIPSFERRSQHPRLHNFLARLHDVTLSADELQRRVSRRARSVLGAKAK